MAASFIMDWSAIFEGEGGGGPSGPSGQDWPMSAGIGLRGRGHLGSPAQKAGGSTLDQIWAVSVACS